MGTPSKRDDYKDLLGVLPDEEIAEQADVTVGTVQRWRRDLDINAPDATDATDAAEAAEADEPEEAVADSDGTPEADEGQGRAESNKQPDPAPAEEPGIPSTVRATGKAILPKCPVLGGRTLRLRFRDVHRGDMAAWLWTHHRKLVEPFPPSE